MQNLNPEFTLHTSIFFTELKDRNIPGSLESLEGDFRGLFEDNSEGWGG